MSIIRPRRGLLTEPNRRDRWPTLSTIWPLIFRIFSFVLRLSSGDSLGDCWPTLSIIRPKQTSLKLIKSLFRSYLSFNNNREGCWPTLSTTCSLFKQSSFVSVTVDRGDRWPTLSMICPLKDRLISSLSVSLFLEPKHWASLSSWLSNSYKAFLLSRCAVALHSEICPHTVSSTLARIASFPRITKFFINELECSLISSKVRHWLFNSYSQ